MVRVSVIIVAFGRDLKVDEEGEKVIVEKGGFRRVLMEVVGLGKLEVVNWK